MKKRKPMSVEPKQRPTENTPGSDNGNVTGPARQNTYYRLVLTPTSIADCCGYIWLNETTEEAPRSAVTNTTTVPITETSEIVGWALERLAVWNVMLAKEKNSSFLELSVSEKRATGRIAQRENARSSRRYTTAAEEGPRDMEQPHRPARTLPDPLHRAATCEVAVNFYGKACINEGTKLPPSLKTDAPWH
ncbi:hypothetical protein T4E_6742 [Trichinella pseudospiralis]|uniref:Uncharacterized protein n=1 Tax=Trichinella pseudospiralis TaxID=6337 RepID=A0A0V0XYN4_TRIPS|nr:hypothetical protein T4E_6742 [Trichinella pseudospiralis]